jgi:hypothetical protein
MRTACCVGVDHKVNYRVIQALVETRLLNRQIMTQPMAIRMAFARCMRTVTICCPVVIVAAIRIHRERDVRPIFSNRFVRIVPATSKQSMDEQRSAQQVTKQSTHYWANRDRFRRSLSVGIYLTQTFDKPRRQSTLKTLPNRHNRHLGRPVPFSGLIAIGSIEVCSTSPTSRPSISAHSFQAVSKSWRYERFFAA